MSIYAWAYDDCPECAGRGQVWRGPMNGDLDCHVCRTRADSELVRLREDKRRLEEEVHALRAALQNIKDTEGHVCANFELCDHVACQSSYGAWSVADGALKEETK